MKVKLKFRNSSVVEYDRNALPQKRYGKRKMQRCSKNIKHCGLCGINLCFE